MYWVNIRDGLHVLVRGWLNANQTVAWRPGVPGSGAVVDTGYVSHAECTIAALRQHAVAACGLKRILNTHCHSDHMGGNAALQRAFGASITIPHGEAAHVVPWDPQNLWLDHTGQDAEVFVPDATLCAGDEFELAGQTWRAFAAPGHAMSALIFWCAAERIAITGDALWQSGTGFVWPVTGENPYVEAALAALDTVESLGPRLVIPGHGAPFDDVAAALCTSRSKLKAFGADPRKAARYTAKALFVFNLLDAGSMTVDAARRQFSALPVYSRLTQEFLGSTPDEFFDEMLPTLVHSRSISVESGVIIPQMEA